MTVKPANTEKASVISSFARNIALAFWIMVFIAIPIWSRYDTSGWDVTVYHAAITSVRRGHDPYTDAAAVQIAYHNRLALHLNTEPDPPYNYVYPPITLPLLRLIGQLPEWLSGLGYWLVYAAGALAVILFGMQFVEDEERSHFAFIGPIAIFFPGLLENGVILSGNVAFCLYGVMLTTAIVGWRWNSWRWFYLTVLLASCFKPQLLTVLAIPVLSVRKQWIPAGITASAGVCLFAVQRIIWPDLFEHFQEAVTLQVSYNRDFGASPAGIFAGILFDHNVAFVRPGFLFYMLYAAPLFSFMICLSRRFLAGAFPLTRWVPVLLTGVVLLDPRIVEYDLAVITMPLALIACRLLPGQAPSRLTVLLTLAAFTLINVAAYQSWIIWKDIACALLVSLFVAGAWQLLALPVQRFRGAESRTAQDFVKSWF